MQTFWFITYSWKDTNNKRIYSHDLHIGSMWAWIDQALKQPENWILINQAEITAEQYKALKFEGYVG